MFMLPDFPLVNQLNDPPTNGQADENARWNCVAAALAAALIYTLHRPFTADALKDAIYGEDYTGPLSIDHFVGYCARLGIHLQHVGGDNSTLIAAIHMALAAGQPVLLTMPSNWKVAPGDPQHFPGYTHVGVACGLLADGVRVMNPWGGFWQDGTDSWWMARLCYGAVWVVTGAREDSMTIEEFATANPWVGQPVETPQVTSFGKECCYTNAIIGWTATGGAFLGDAGRQLAALRQQIAALAAPPAEMQRALTLAQAVRALLS